MVCHLWDLADEGLEGVLDRLAGEVGVTGVCLPVVCPSASHLRARPGVAAPAFRIAGGVFFTPQEEFYVATRCKPVVSKWLRSRDLFRRVAEACQARSLECRAIVDASSAGDLASRYPHAAAKTAFGDAWPARVCPVNPDVQAFLAAVCRDLATNYQISAIELAGLSPGRAASARSEFDLAPDLGPGGWALMGVCFCESCRQLGGTGPGFREVDPAAAARSVEVRLRRVFDSGEQISGGVDGVFSQDQPLAAHVAAQWRAIGDLVATIAGECGCDLVLRWYDNAICAAAGTVAIRELAPEVRFQMPVPMPLSADAVERTARAACELAGGAARAELLMRPFGPDAVGSGETLAQALVADLARLADLGLASVDLESYGQASEAGLAAVRQAVRFARRAPGGPGDGRPA